ncbi:hypothetical protein [Fonticella tunisiensis]|uniref:DUF2283 domain-containing protein n=1 Tax=Fonticella tunisiensis TaxID=1096341 RepID=A0A4R7KQ85_9CLOT|nr:hypothetical protein [Fonticella tunisiensis]TDT58427.1 hypothetical protein EDD71_11175 [Fonticella tunisiensis]
MEVFYDRKNDVVSIYFDLQGESGIIEENGLSKSKSEREYEIDEAASLVLDMVDLVDEDGNLKGFRVFNASKHYDVTLLNCAEFEELSQEEMRKMPQEKIVARFYK